MDSTLPPRNAEAIESRGACPEIEKAGPMSFSMPCDPEQNKHAGQVARPASLASWETGSSVLPDPDTLIRNTGFEHRPPRRRVRGQLARQLLQLCRRTLHRIGGD